MLFIPAFFWHQVTTEESAISINMFFGDAGQHAYLSKLLAPESPQYDVFRHWVLNVIEQNRSLKHFPEIRKHLRGSLAGLMYREWYEEPSEEILDELCSFVRAYLEPLESPADGVEEQ